MLGISIGGFETFLKDPYYPTLALKYVQFPLNAFKNNGFENLSLNTDGFGSAEAIKPIPTTSMCIVHSMNGI